MNRAAPFQRACLQVVEGPVPDDMAADVAAKRAELLECVANVDDAVMELFIEEQPVDGATLAAAVRRATINTDFFPVFIGSAYKNVGVQLLLDGVSAYLPDPTEVRSPILCYSATACASCCSTASARTCPTPLSCAASLEFGKPRL